MAVWIGVVQAHRAPLSFAAVTRYAQQFFQSIFAFDAIPAV